MANRSVQGTHGTKPSGVAIHSQHSSTCHGHASGDVASATTTPTDSSETAQRLVPNSNLGSTSTLASQRALSNSGAVQAPLRIPSGTSGT